MHGVGQYCVGRLVRQILLAREKPYEGGALLSERIANGAQQDRVTRFERVDARSLRERAGTSS